MVSGRPDLVRFGNIGSFSSETSSNSSVVLKIPRASVRQRHCRRSDAQFRKEVNSNGAALTTRHKLGPQPSGAGTRRRVPKL
jgi:hypothetical protein